METIEAKTSKKLAKLGLRVESGLLWRYKDTKGNGKLILELRRFADTELIVGDSDILYYRAYTLDEILAMLPDNTTIYKYLGSHQAMYVDSTSETDDNIQIHKNPAEAAAQLLIWCIENGYVKVEDINNGKK